MDKGHENLIRDIKDLLWEAENYQFHDFQNSRYRAPKKALAEALAAMRQKVIDGLYDN